MMLSVQFNDLRDPWLAAQYFAQKNYTVAKSAMKIFIAKVALMDTNNEVSSHHVV